MFFLKSKRPRKVNSTELRLSSALITILVIAGIIYLFSNKYSKAAVSGDPIVIVNQDDLVSIPTPSRNIARGERVEALPLTYIKWPKSRISEEYLNDPSNYKNFTTLTPLPKLLPIPLSAISNKVNDKNQVAEAIPQGMRAITVKVDAESAVEGWAQSGNYVDVILVKLNKENENGLEAKVIAENIKILSAGSSALSAATDSTAPKAPSTATLLTSQEDALKIKTAASLGKLTFALRGTGDQLKTDTTVMDQRALLGSSRSIITPKKDYKGMAKGPDGKVYLLGDSSKWIRSLS
nr:Flp pilus assembly protein CpaB [Pseudomonadota bacterium]